LSLAGNFERDSYEGQFKDDQFIVTATS
jgi:hypothetical protein